MSDKTPLFEDFPPISSDSWKEKVTIDLKGVDFDKKLVWKTQEGFNVQPYYREEDLAKLASLQVEKGTLPVTRGTNSEGNQWKIRQDFAKTSSVKDLNKKILRAISRGAEALGIDLSGFVSADDKTLSTILAEVNIGETELYFTGIKDFNPTYKILVELAGTDIALLKGSLGVDPVGLLASSGELSHDFTALAELIQTAAEHTPSFKIISIDAGQLQNAGSTLSQELGFGLSMANIYLEELSESGLSAEEAMNAISFSFTTGPNYFMEIAKLRAARWLWTVICKAWGVEVVNTEIHIHSRTASWNLTVYDPNINMLRSTTEAMSASLGGSDVISVLPFDSTFKEENDFSSRIARNVQVILKEEAYFSKVADPSAGSYYIEQLTESIAEQAWKHFLEADEKGGFIEAFKSGWIQEQIKTSADSKLSRAASRRESIIGVNQFPNINEMILQDLAVAEKDAQSSSTYEPLVSFKIAKELEELRLQTEKMDKRPKVFLLKYGDPVMRTARAIFSGNFFGCAGYEIIDSSGFETINDGITAAKEAGANIVVLCSSDAGYPEIGPATQKAMGDSAEIVIAGYPKDAIEELQSAGIKHFIHVRTNLLDELKKFNELFA